MQSGPLILETRRSWVLRKSKRGWRETSLGWDFQEKISVIFTSSAFSSLVIMSTGLLAAAHTTILQSRKDPRQRSCCSHQLVSFNYRLALSRPPNFCLSSPFYTHERQLGSRFHVSSCLPSSSSSSSSSLPMSSSSDSTKLYVSGLSFRTTKESLRSAFEQFGQLVEVNLVMDRIANRPRGFAFLRYATEDESQKAIEGMHGKFLDGRVIFVEVAKPRSEVQKKSR